MRRFQRLWLAAVFILATALYWLGPASTGANCVWLHPRWPDLTGLHEVCLCEIAGERYALLYVRDEDCVWQFPLAAVWLKNGSVELRDAVRCEADLARRGTWRLW